MKRIVVAIVLLLLSACAPQQQATQPVVHIPTRAAPVAPAAASVDTLNLPGWDRVRAYDNLCDYDCRAYQHESGALLHVYDDGIVIGVDLMTNQTEQGRAIDDVIAYFAVPREVNEAMMDMGDAVAARGSGEDFNMVRGWQLGFSMDEEGFIVMTFLWP